MKTKTLMTIAEAIAKESKCTERQVGAIIVKDGRIISTGYNGTPSGLPNCNDIKPFNHKEWQWSYEIHAEINAIIYAARSTQSIEGATMVVNLEPCSQCAKAIANSGIVRVIYKGSYSDSGVELLKQAGVEVVEYVYAQEKVEEKECYVADMSVGDIDPYFEDFVRLHFPEDEANRLLTLGGINSAERK